MNYEVKWSYYRQWCRSEGYSISRPTLRLWISCFGSVRLRSCLSPLFWVIFRCIRLYSAFKLPEISSSSFLKDLLRSFKVDAPVRPIHPPPCNLDAVLHFLSLLP